MRKILLCLIFILMLGSASAVVNTTIDTIAGRYTTSCAAIEWTYTATTETDWDFNVFHIDVESNVNSLEVIYGDRNTHDTDFLICTFSDEDYVTVTITPIDSNVTDFNFTFIYGTPQSFTVDAVSPLAGGRYMIFEIFAVLGSIVLLIILAVVAALIVVKFNLKIPMGK